MVAQSAKSAQTSHTDHKPNPLWSFQASDDEKLKQLNDEQILKLLEEAYHSKKLDDQNKCSFFKVSCQSSVTR